MILWELAICLFLLHSVPLMQVVVTVSSTCPAGQAHCGASHVAIGLGSLQIAFPLKQLAVKICPFIGYVTSK